jgi:hypothetical protein
LDHAQQSIGELTTLATGWLDDVLREVWSGGRALISVFSLAVVTPVVACYVVNDWKRMIEVMDNWVPPARRDTVRALAREINDTIGGSPSRSFGRIGPHFDHSRDLFCRPVSRGLCTIPIFRWPACQPESCLDDIRAFRFRLPVRLGWPFNCGAAGRCYRRPRALRVKAILREPALCCCPGGSSDGCQTLRVESSSTDDSRLRGARPMIDIGGYATALVTSGPAIFGSHFCVVRTAAPAP